MADEEHGLDLRLGAGPKQIALALALAFAVALAVVVGKKMSTEAMAVVIGVICGVAAGLPTSVLLMLAFTRRDRLRQEETDRQSAQRAFPPVVVIQGGAPQGMPSLSQAGYWPATPPGPPLERRFHVVGDDDLLVDAEVRPYR